MGTMTSFAKLKSIDDRKKSLIFGYIRNIEKLCNIDHSPPLIKHMCILFYSLFIESNILTLGENKTLERLLSAGRIGPNPKWTLLYNGRDVKTFNKRVDRRKNILCIIHARSADMYDNVFGGFLHNGFGLKVLWNNSNMPKHDYLYAADPNAFLFLIRSSKGYKPEIFDIKSRCAKLSGCRSDTHMCLFGNGDISLCDGYSSGGSCVDAKWKDRVYNTPSEFYLNGDIKYFNVASLEVSTCISCTCT